MAEVSKRKRTTALKKKDASPVDFQSIWRAVSREKRAVETPKTIEDLENLNDTASFYTRNILSGLLDAQFLYGGYLVHHEREQAINYLMDILPFLVGELPADAESVKEFITRFAFSPVRSEGTDFQSLFSRVAFRSCGHWQLPERYKGILWTDLSARWEAYSGKSPYEKGGPLVEAFLEEIVGNY